MAVPSANKSATTGQRQTGARRPVRATITSVLAALMVAVLITPVSPASADLAVLGTALTGHGPGQQFGRVVAADDHTLAVGGSRNAWVFDAGENGAWVNRQALTPTEGVPTTDYGHAVATATNREGSRRLVVVGDPNQVEAGVDAGAAHLFEWTAATGWQHRSRLLGPAADADGSFGAAVAVEYIDETTAVVIVTAVRDGGDNGYATSRLVRPTSISAAEIIKSPLTDPGDLFGISAAIDGGTLVIGALLDNDSGGGARSGTATVFEADYRALEAGTQDLGWDVSAHLSLCGVSAPGAALPSCGTSTGEGFGYSVAIDDDTIVGGAWLSSSAGGGDAGRMRVFRRTDGQWTAGAIVQSTESQSTDRLGTRVAIRGARMVATAWNRDGGIGGVRSFVYDGSLWTEELPLTLPSDAAAGDRAGQGLAITTDRVVIGSPFHDGAGADAGQVTTHVAPPDNQAAVSFPGTGFPVAEDAGSLVIDVAVDGVIRTPVELLWMASTVEPGAYAAAPADASDFSAIGVVRMEPQATSARLEIPIVDDDDLEGPEVFEVTLISAVPGVTVRAPSTIAVTITDPEDEPTVDPPTIEGTDGQAQEASGGGGVLFSVSNAPTGSYVRAEVLNPDGTVLTTADGIPIDDGVALLDLSDDNLPEAPQTYAVIFTLLAADGTTELATDTAQLTVYDDDDPGIPTEVDDPRVGADELASDVATGGDLASIIRSWIDELGATSLPQVGGSPAEIFDLDALIDQFDLDLDLGDISSLDDLLAKLAALGFAPEEINRGGVAPVTQADLVVVPSNATTTATTNVLANDYHPDGRAFWLDRADASAEGLQSVSIDPDGTITVTPEPGFEGDAEISYVVCSAESCTPGTVTVAVGPAYSTPEPVADFASINIGEVRFFDGIVRGPVNVLDNDTIPDGTTLQLQSVEDSELVSGFTPAGLIRLSAVGIDTPSAVELRTIEYEVCSEAGLCSIGDLHVYLNPEDAPIATRDVLSIGVGGVGQIDVDVNDAGEGRAVLVGAGPVLAGHEDAFVTPPALVSPGRFEVTLAPETKGQSLFSYETCRPEEGLVYCSVGIVEVRRVNGRGPIAVDDELTVPANVASLGVALDVMGAPADGTAGGTRTNDWHPDQQAIYLSSPSADEIIPVTSAAGVVIGEAFQDEDHQLRIRPIVQSNGLAVSELPAAGDSASFTYEICDIAVSRTGTLCSTADVTLTFGPPSPPSVSPGAVRVDVPVWNGPDWQRANPLVGVPLHINNPSSAYTARVTGQPEDAAGLVSASILGGTAEVAQDVSSLAAEIDSAVPRTVAVDVTVCDAVFDTVCASTGAGQLSVRFVEVDQGQHLRAITDRFAVLPGTTVRLDIQANDQFVDPQLGIPVSTQLPELLSLNGSFAPVDLAGVRISHDGRYVTAVVEPGTPAGTRSFTYRTCRQLLTDSLAFECTDALVVLDVGQAAQQECGHFPLFAVPGQEVTIYSKNLDPKVVSPAGAINADDMQLLLDDSVVAEGSERPVLEHVFVMGSDPFTYECRQAGRSFGTFRVEPWNAAASTTRAIAVREVVGGGGVSMVLAPEQGLTRPFETKVEEAVYAVRDQPVLNRYQDSISFYATTRTGRITQQCSISHTFANSRWRRRGAGIVFVLHDNPAWGCFTGRLASANTPAVFLHEFGHFAAGLSDEYGGARYYEGPNVHTTMARCVAAQQAENPWGACRRIAPFGTNPAFFTYDPPTNDVMVDNRQFNAADIRAFEAAFTGGAPVSAGTTPRRAPGLVAVLSGTPGAPTIVIEEGAVPAGSGHGDDTTVVVSINRGGSDELVEASVIGTGEGFGLDGLPIGPVSVEEPFIEGVVEIDRNVQTITLGEGVDAVVFDVRSQVADVCAADGDVLGCGALADLIRVRRTLSLDELMTTGETGVGFGLEAAGSFSEFFETSGLSVDGGWRGSVTIDLVIGVDAEGFFVSDASAAMLSMGGNVAVTGSPTIAGVPLALSGGVSGELEIAVRATGAGQKIRLSQLADPASYLELSAAGEVGVYANGEVGPLRVGVAAVAEVLASSTDDPVVELAVDIPVELAIPGVTGTDGEPVVMLLNGSYDNGAVRVVGTTALPDGALLDGFAIENIVVDTTITQDGIDGGLTADLLVDSLDATLPVRIEFDADQVTVTGGPVDLGGRTVGVDPTWLDITSGSLSASWTGSTDGTSLTGEVRVDSVTADVLPENPDLSARITEMSGVLRSDGTAVLTAAGVAGTVLGTEVSFTGITARLDRDPLVPFFEADSAAAGVFGLEGLQIFRDGTFSVAGACAQNESGLLGAAGLGGILPVEITSACVRSEEGGVRTVDVTGTFDLDAGLASWPSGPALFLDGEPIQDGDPFAVVVQIPAQPTNPGGFVTPLDLPEVRLEFSDPGVEGIEGSLTITIPAHVAGVRQGPITAALSGSADLGGAESFSVTAGGEVEVVVTDTAAGSGSVSFVGQLSAAGGVGPFATITGASGQFTIDLDVAGARVTGGSIGVADLSVEGVLQIPGLSDDGSPISISGSYSSGVWRLSVSDDTLRLGIVELSDVSLDIVATPLGVGVSGGATASLVFDGDGDGNTGDTPPRADVTFSASGDIFSLTTDAAAPVATVGEVFALDGGTVEIAMSVDLADGSIGGSATFAADEFTWFPDDQGGGLAQLSDPVAELRPDGSFSLTASQLESSVLSAGVTVRIANPTLVFTDTPQGPPVLSAASAEIEAFDLNGGVELADLAIYRDGSFTIGSACVAADAGLLGSFGLAGILPFEVTEACLISAEGNDTLVEITGWFDLSRLDSWDFTTTLTVDGIVVNGGPAEVHTFSVLVDTEQPLASWPRPVDLPPITIAVDDVEVAGETVSGYLSLPGWVDGATRGDFDGDITLADDEDAASDEGADSIVDLSGSATVTGDLELLDNGVAGEALLVVNAAGSVDGYLPSIAGWVTVAVEFAANNRDGVAVDAAVQIREADLSATLDVAGISGVDAGPLTVTGAYNPGTWSFTVGQESLDLGGFRADNVNLAVDVSSAPTGELVIGLAGAADMQIIIGEANPIPVSVAFSAANGQVRVDGGVGLGRLDLGEVILLDGSLNDPDDGPPVPDLTFALTSDVRQGTVDASAALNLPRVVLFPEDPATSDEGLLVLETVTGSVSSDGSADLAFASADIVLGGLFAIELTGGAVSVGDDTRPLLSVAETSGSILDDDGAALLSLTVTDLVIEGDGAVSVGSIVVSDITALANALGLGGILPVELASVSVAFDEPGNFDAFELRATGTFKTDVLSGLPFTPVIRIGGVEANTFTAALRVSSLREGRFELVDFGVVELGIEDWQLGPFNLSGSLTFTSQGSEQPPTVQGSVAVRGAADDGSASVDASAEVVATPTLSNTGGTLQVDFSYEVSTELSSLISVTKASGSLGFTLELDTTEPSLGLMDDSLSLSPVSFEELTVGFGDLMRFTATAGTFDPLPERGAPIISFPDGSLDISFGALDENGEPDPDDPLSGWGGSVGGFEIRNGTVPDGVDDDTLDERLPRVVLLPGFNTSISIGDPSDLGIEGLPFEARELGISFPGLGDEGGVDLRDTDNFPQNGQDLLDLVDDISDFRIRFTGGFVQSDAWPITATVTDLELDMGVLKNWLEGDFSELPITGLTDVELIMDPVNLGPVVIGGGFGIGVILEDEDGNLLDAPLWYGKIAGDFAYGSMGLGIELVVSQYGPVAGRLKVPAVIPLGPSTFIISGARGSLQFDGTTTNRIEPNCSFTPDGTAVCDDFDLPDLDNPDLSADVIREKLQGLIATFGGLDPVGDPVGFAADIGEQWAKGFSFTIGGSLTQAAVTGVLSGDITIGATVALDLGGEGEPFGEDNRLLLLGQGQLEFYGTALGQVNLVADLSEPIDPIFTIGFKMPGGGDLLGLLVPGEGSLVATADYEGVYGSALIGMREFLVRLASASADHQELRDLFLPLVDTLAARLNVRRSSHLARLLLDGVAPPRVLDGNWLIDRILGRNGLPPLIRDITPFINEDEGALEGIAEADLILAATVAAALMGDLIDVATELGQDEPPNLSTLTGLEAELADRLGAYGEKLENTAGMDVALALVSVLADAVGDSAAVAFAVYDPTIAVRGSIQPKLLGIPLGEPRADLTIVLKKDEIGLTASGSLRDSLRMVAAVCPTCGIAVDAASLGGLIDDRTSLKVRVGLPFDVEDLLGEFSFPAIDPYEGDWSAAIGGSLLIAGFEIGDVDGLIVPGTLGGGSNPVLDAFVSDPEDPLYLQPDASVISRLEDTGGILVDGRLLIPDLFADPERIIGAVQANGEVPDDPLKFFTWLQDNVALLSGVTEAGGFQVYVPAPTPELGDYLSAIDVATLDDGVDLDPVLEQAFADLFGDAYVQGAWDIELLGLPVSNGRVLLGTAADEDGAVVEVEFPWFPEAVRFVANVTTVDDPDGDDRSIPWPTLGGEVTLTSADVVAVLDGLGLPTDVFEHAGGAATLRAYSPGYDPEGDVLQRNGGVELLVQANIAGLVDDVALRLRLLAPVAGVIPDFSVSLAVDTLSLGGIDVDIDTLTLERTTRLVGQAGGRPRVETTVGLQLSGSVEHPLFAGSVSGFLTSDLDGELVFDGRILSPGGTGILSASGTITSSGVVDITMGTLGVLSVGPASFSGRFRVSGGGSQPYVLRNSSAITASLAGFGSVSFDTFEVDTLGHFDVQAIISLGNSVLGIEGTTIRVRRGLVLSADSASTTSTRVSLSGGQLVILGTAQPGFVLPTFTTSFGDTSTNTFSLDRPVTFDLDLGPAFVLDGVRVDVNATLGSVTIDQVGTASISALGGTVGAEIDGFFMSSGGSVAGDVTAALRVGSTTFAEADFSVSRPTSNGPLRMTLDADAEVDVGGAGNLVADFSGWFESDGSFAFAATSSASFEVPSTGLFYGAYELDLSVAQQAGATSWSASGEVCLPLPTVDVDPPDNFFDFEDWKDTVEVNTVSCAQVSGSVAGNGVISGSATFQGLGTKTFSFPPNAASVSGDGDLPEFVGVPTEPVIITVPSTSAVDVGGEERYEAQYAPPTAGGDLVSCAPAAGTYLAAGEHLVSCTAVNAFGSTTVWFYVEVVPVLQFITVISLVVNHPFSGEEDRPSEESEAGRKVVESAGAVTVRGEGAQPGARGQVSVFSEPRQLATFVVGADGTYSTTVTIPADLALGDHNLVVRVENDAGRLELRHAPLSVVPSGSLAPPPCTITGTERADVLLGTRGDDVICGLGGADRIYGLGGNDIILGGAGRDLIFGGDGDDWILAGDGADRVSGGDGADHIEGNDGSDRLDGGAGNDTLDGRNGADQIDGGRGDDLLLGGAGADRLSGGWGADLLQGQDGRDRLFGGRGDDVLEGGRGNDLTVGGQGNDVIRSG